MRKLQLELCHRRPLVLLHAMNLKERAGRERVRKSVRERREGGEVLER